MKVGAAGAVLVAALGFTLLGSPAHATAPAGYGDKGHGKYDHDKDYDEEAFDFNNANFSENKKSPFSGNSIKDVDQEAKGCANVTVTNGGGVGYCDHVIIADGDVVIFTDMDDDNGNGHNGHDKYKH